MQQKYSKLKLDSQPVTGRLSLNRELCNIKDTQMSGISAFHYDNHLKSNGAPYRG
jgi:hypothetical protein